MWYEIFADYLSPQIATIFIAMLPVVELRGAIPVAVGVYGLDFLSAFILSVIGNMIPAFFILFGFEKMTSYLRERFKLCDDFFKWLFDRTKKKFNHQYDTYGMIGLLLFVAVPLPLTGLWTGAIAAYLLDLPKRKVLPYLFGGVVIAGIITSIMVRTAIWIL